jgi:hypothetical protein
MSRVKSKNTKRNKRVKQKIPRQMSSPVTVFERTLRLADFPPSVDGVFIAQTVTVNNLFIQPCAELSKVFSQYRFTMLNFIYQPLKSVLEVGNIFLAFDSRIDIGPPRTIDDVMGKPLYKLTQACNTNFSQTNGSNRGLLISRSVNQFTWYECAVPNGALEETNTMGLLFFGGDQTQIGSSVGHLSVHFRIVFRN